MAGSVKSTVDHQGAAARSGGFTALADLGKPPSSAWTPHTYATI